MKAGATAVTAAPYFLSAGRQVASDIPTELEKAERMHQAVTIQQSDYLGKHESIVELLLTLAMEKDAPGRTTTSVHATG